MCNFQAEPRPLFNERRSRVFVMKDEIPDITQISQGIESSVDLSHSRLDRSTNNFLSPQITPQNKAFGGKQSSEVGNGVQGLIPNKRKSNERSSKTFVYDGIEDKVILTYYYSFF